MKKFIYILVLVAVILSCVVVPISASDYLYPDDDINYGPWPELMLDPEFALDYMQTYVVDDSIKQSLLPNNQIVFLTSLSNVPVSAQVIGDYNGEETILSSTTISSYGQTIILSKYHNGTYTYRLRDQYDNPQKFLLTIIEGADDYSSSFADYYSSLIQVVLESYEASVPDGPGDGSDLIQTSAIASVDGVVELTIEQNEYIFIQLNNNPGYACLDIYQNNKCIWSISYSEGLIAFDSPTVLMFEPDPSNTNNNYRIVYESSESGDAGSFTVYKVTRDSLSEKWQEGYDQGYSQGASDNANSGYSDGYSDGYDQGYSQGALDNANGGYSDGYDDGVATGEATVLNQIRAYLRSQGIEPVGNTVSELMMCYADSISSSNENWDAESYQNAFNAGYEYAGSIYIPQLEEKYNEGREYTMGLIDDFMERKEIVIPEGTVRAVGTYLELVYTANGCYADHDAIYNAGKQDGLVLGRAEGFDSSFITDGVDSIVEGTSRTFLQVLNVEVLGYTFGSVVIGFIMVVFVLFAVKFIGSIL